MLAARRANQLQIAIGYEETPETIAISGVLVAAAGLELSDMKTITFSVSYNSKI